MKKLLVSLSVLIIGLMLSGPATAKKGMTTDASLLAVKENGKLVIGVDIPYGVMEFYDKSGKAVGIDIDIANEIVSRIGVSLVVKKMPFSKLFDALKNGEVDVVISAVTITSERQKKMLFSVPYLDAGVSIAVRKDNMDIKSVENLKGKKVGVLKGTIAEGLATKSEHIDPSLIRKYDKNDERIQDLLDGKLDAIVVHFLVKDFPLLKLVGEPLSQSYYGVVTRLNNNTLMDEINKTLRELKRNGKLKKIKRKYINTK